MVMGLVGFVGDSSSGGGGGVGRSMIKVVV